MAQVRVSIAGQSDLIKVLGAPEVDRKVREVTELGATRSRSVCPIDTGALVRSIETDFDSELGHARGRWGSDLHYAPHVEYGHTTRAGTHVKAQPFLRSAAKSL